MGIYSALENKWYSLLETIDKVIPVTKLTDKIDSVFPSFILFLIIIFILLIGFFFFFSSDLSFNTTYDAKITVLSKIGLPLSGVNVTLIGDCGEDEEPELIEGVTNSDGKVNLEVCSNVQQVTLSKTGYTPFSEEVDIEIDNVFRLSAAPPQIKSITALVKDEQENLISDATVELVCDSNTTLFENQSTQGFFIDIPLTCQVIQLRASAPGYKEKTKTLLDTDERIIINLEKKVVTGKVIFETQTPTVSEPYVEIQITDFQNKSISEITDGSGTKEVTLNVGTYTYNALSRKGESRNGSFSIFANTTERVKIDFTDIAVESKKAIYLKIVDPLDNAVTNARVSIYQDGNSLTSRSTNALGETTPITIDPDTLPLGTKFTGVVKAPGYETKFVDLVIVEKSGDPQKIVITQGGATLKVNHEDDLSKRLKDAFTTLYYNGFNEVFDSGTSDTNGEVIFKNLPAGTYKIKSVYTRTDSDGEETVTLTQNETKEITIVLVTGSGKMKFEFFNQVGTKIDTNYEFYERIDGMLQKTVSGESTRGYYSTNNIKSRTPVKLATTNPEYFPHETITYKMSRITQNKDVFMRELNSLPNSKTVQMFLVGIYTTNPLTDTFADASKITAGGTYYLYFDIILNNENTNYLLGDFKIGDNNYLSGPISIENVYSIDGYTRVMTQNSSGMIIDDQSPNLVDENAVQANMLLQDQTGKKSIPVFLEIKVDINALAEERIPLYFQARHGDEMSLQYRKDIVVGESVCMFEYDSDCPAFLVSHYLKWNDKEYVPLQDNHTVLIGDNYKIKTTVTNLTDEDIGESALKLVVPKEKLAYFTIGNDTNTVIHSVNLYPFQATLGKETELNLIKKTNSGKINIFVEKEVDGLDSLTDYELNEDEISFKVVDKKELAIEIVPGNIYQDSEIPFFYVKTKYKSEYKGTSAIWYVEKNGVRLGQNYQGQTDTNGIQITSFDAKPFDEGDVLTFIAEDLNGNVPARLDVTVKDPFPPAPQIQPSCLKLKLPNGTFANDLDIPNFSIGKGASAHITVVSDCNDARMVYLYTDQYVSENNFTIAAGEEKDITVTGVARDNIYGAYPLQLLEIGSVRYSLIAHIDIIVGGNAFFDLQDAILDFRLVDTVSTSIVNRNFAGRKDIYNPQASISTNAVALAYNKPGIPEIIQLKPKVVESGMEVAVTGFGWAEKFYQTKSGDGCGPTKVAVNPTKSYFAEEAAEVCALTMEEISNLEPEIIEEPELDITDPTKPFYTLPVSVQNVIVSQIANQEGPVGSIIEEEAVEAKGTEKVDKASFCGGSASPGVGHSTSGWATGIGTPAKLGHNVTPADNATAGAFVFYPFGPTPEGESDCFDLIHTLDWVSAPRPPEWESCAYEECAAEATESHVAKWKLVSAGGHCNSCAVNITAQTAANASGTPAVTAPGEEAGEIDVEAGVNFLLHTRGEDIPCGLLGLGCCNKRATLIIQPEFNRILTWTQEMKAVWEGDYNIVPIEGKVYTLGSYESTLVPKWTDLSMLEMFGSEEGALEGDVWHTPLCAAGMGFIPIPYFGDAADPWIEYGPSGYTKYQLVEVPNNVRMFLKNQTIYAEYIGTTDVASNNIDMTFTKKDLQGNQYAIIEIQDWVSNGAEEITTPATTTTSLTLPNFLWKPVSENTGKLVVLYSPAPSGNAEVYGPNNVLIEVGDKQAGSNGYSQTVRFNHPGSYYPSGSYFKIGNYKCKINNPGGRVQSCVPVTVSTPATTTLQTNAKKEKAYFQVKLVGNEHNCFASDGTEGVTGTYYTPKLLFDWDWNNINYNQCDSDNPTHTYCDGVQFNISLIKRLDKIDTLFKEGKLNDIPKETGYFAYLIKDNYNQALLDDFATYYAGAFLQTGTAFNKFKKFIENNKLTYQVNLESGVGTSLGYGGLYRVEIDIDRDNENLYSLFNGENLNATIKITLRPIERAPDYNPFYETPFDGDIGSQRNGYGTSVDTDGLRLNELVVADSKGSSALTDVGFVSSTSLPILNNEIVLKYNGDQLEFYPAQPTPVEATIVGSAGTVRAEYVAEGTGAANLPTKKWKLTSSTIGGTKCHDFADNEVAFVNDIVNGSVHKFIWNGTKSGTLGLTTTFFTPKNNSDTLRITPGLGNITLNSKASLINSSTIMLQNYDQQGITNYDTLQGVFDMIKDEKLCMSKQADDEMQIFWNPDYLDELTESVQTGSGSSC